MQCRFWLGTVLLGVCRLALSLLGYFFYVSTAFTAIMVLLISLFNNSTLERVRHYPRPIILWTVTATKNVPRPPLVAPGTTEESRAKDTPAKDIKESPVASIAKANAEKSKRVRLAHLHKLKVLARLRKNYEGHGYTTALGYAEESGYGPVRSFAERPY